MADAANRAGTGGGRTNFQPDPLVNVRERLFHTLFFRITLAYARTCPKWFRRLIELMLLLKAVACLLILVYIHLAFARHPVKCLEDVKDTWPKEGILRVEIMRSPPDSYDIEASYEKERQMQRYLKAQEDYPAVSAFFNFRSDLISQFTNNFNLTE